MLNRRYLRIKAMQALYAFFQSDSQDINKGEREMLSSINKIYDLYIYLLTLLIDVRDVASVITEDARSKRLPTAEDINPNLKFLNNKLIAQLSSNKKLLKEAAARKISWQNERELIKKIFLDIRAGEVYKKYMSSGTSSFNEDAEFVAEIFKNHIAEFDLLEHFFEEKSIYWVDDLRLVNIMIAKTVLSFKEEKDVDNELMGLYKDEEDDRQFVIDLFRKTILHNEEVEKSIAAKTENWEVERIAMMDVLLMKMAITEILYFSNIPVKVTLNEYIEISKLYSTPKSKGFINGILDNLVIDLKKDNKINKVGRGLLE
jgi:transcription antitermination protein NusB